MGVDGGGTKSHLTLFNQAGECVGFKARGTLNHERMENSFDELARVLPDFLHGALGEAGVGVNDLAYSVFGLAGVDLEWQHESISEILHKAGFSPGSFTLCNDAYLGVPAGCLGGAGICAINGTGSTLAAINPDGKRFQLSGLGVLTDDCGGSTWFAEQVLAAVYNSLYKYAKPTLLKNLMFEKLGITRREDYIETLADKLYSVIEFNDLNRLVFEAAAKRDEAAIDIIRRSGEHYAGGIAYLAREMDFPEAEPLSVAFAGSVFVREKVQLLPELIKQRVAELLGARPVEFRTLDTFPVAGAVLWAAREAGFDIGIEKIKKGLPI
jgi:N-acetylglucosamine kinase-like BadF-type ATPase